MYLFFSPHNWMAFVRLNKRLLCYVICVGVIVRGKRHTPFKHTQNN